MSRRELLIFLSSLVLSAFLLGIGGALWFSGCFYFKTVILAGLLINGLGHFFFWKKFWNLLKSLQKK